MVKGDFALKKLRHDIKNYLTVIRLNLFLLKKDLPPEKEQFAVKIEEKLELILRDLEKSKKG
ncbi:MAG: hypothetical protein UV73_C0003G0088 [Candidatus Gottesmanbacteria bacterium GW2011_GWA2_43_14]|uniref:Uncharacterized protein n=1 Tax=Candidatus Gottesmanbacteria bacterium GW2011_GWA2_43_14 TaxID=1618443 RepID=A0A0G1FT13_9BACT|nr:MAG: hypothetical protein UV73_C0003G0088 [Candidatus Gottesmanbacteria bacterium GW2011_GWA2_43_14]